MSTLNSVQRRALSAASLTMAGALLLILLYWQAVSKGSLPSPAQPLVAKPETVDSNPPPAKAVTVVAIPVAPAPALVSKATAWPDANQPAPSSVASKPNVADAASAAETTNAVTRTPLKPPVTKIAATASSPARPVTPNVSTSLTVEDERVARHWLENTNQRPTIRVRYQAADILRLTTELNRGLFVAGSGTTNRREIFLQSRPGAAPLFSPFTKNVAQQFSSYSLALNSSPAFGPLTTPLPAYFPDGEFDLAFVPDRTLATDIFAKAANALRSLSKELASSSDVVFEGQLRLTGTQPVFELLEARLGTNRHQFASQMAGDPR
jgi:hypothetical protein